MNELKVLFQRWSGSTDDDIIFLLVDGKNYTWQLHEGHDGRFAGLGSKNWTRTSTKIPLESTHQELSTGIIIM